jgi:hypothetical protein
MENTPVPKEKEIFNEDQRKEIARSIFEKAEEMDVPIEMNKSGTGGYINITEGKDPNSISSKVEWSVSKYGWVSIAGVLPSNTKSGYNYLIDSDDYQTASTVTRKNLIALSRKVVKYEGVVATALEALVEIPTLGGWYIDCDDKELSTLLKHWLSTFGSSGTMSIDDNNTVVQTVGGIEKFTINMLWSLYQDGDAVITEAWENVPVPKLKNKRRNLPTRYVEHDVAELEIPPIMAKFGQEVIYAKPDEDITAIISGGNLDDKQKRALEMIPDELISSLKEGDEEIELPAEFTSHFSRRTNNRDPWGLPYVVKAYPSLAYKHRLRDLDNATIDGLIQRIWIVKIGHNDVDSPLHLPDNDRVLLAVSAFRKLQTQNFLVWGGSDLSTEEFGSSENNVLSFKDRYNSADKDILSALGVPRVLIDGEGSADANLNAFVKTISQMERYQTMIKRWIDLKMYQIAVENGYKDQFPTFHWQFLKMQDNEKAKNIITKLFELGVINIRMLHNLIGLDSEMIIKHGQREKKENLKDSLPENTIPYSRPMNDGRPDDSKDGDGDPKTDTKKNDPDSKRDGKDK